MVHSTPNTAGQIWRTVITGAAALPIAAFAAAPAVNAAETGLSEPAAVEQAPPPPAPPADPAQPTPPPAPPTNATPPVPLYVVDGDDSPGLLELELRLADLGILGDSTAPTLVLPVVTAQEDPATAQGTAQQAPTVVPVN